MLSTAGYKYIYSFTAMRNEDDLYYLVRFGFAFQLSRVDFWGGWGSAG